MNRLDRRTSQKIAYNSNNTKAPAATKSGKCSGRDVKKGTSLWAKGAMALLGLTAAVALTKFFAPSQASSDNDLQMRGIGSGSSTTPQSSSLSGKDIARTADRNHEFDELIESLIPLLPEGPNWALHDLSPVHLTALTGHHAALASLQKQGWPMDEPDAYGFTALHYMAMKGDIPGVKKLLEWGANPHHKNSLGGSYADLLRFNAPFREPSDFKLNATLFSAHTHSNTYVDPRCIPEGVTYVEENVIRPTDLFRTLILMEIDYFLDESASYRQHKTEVAGKYQAFKDSPPQLSIEPINRDDEGNTVDLGPAFCGVVAKQDIKKGELITEYAGELFGVQPDTEYMWGTPVPWVDAKSFRSAGAMINHAFPNADMKSWYGMSGKGSDGVPNRKVLIAIDDIAAGEEITIDYGNSYAWSHTPIQLRPQAVRKFVTQNGWQHLCDVFDSTVKRGQLYDAKITQFLSVITSTSNLVQLAKNGLINSDEFARIKSIVKRLSLETDLDAVGRAIQSS